MKKVLDAIAMLASIAAVVSLTGCVTPKGGPLEGVVTSAETGMPLEGVFVIAYTRIQGADMVGSRSSCSDLEVVRSDAQGRYKLTPGTAISADRIIMAHAPGLDDEFDTKSSTGKRMIRFKGTDEERAASFVTYAPLISCGPRASTREKLLPLYQALDAELGKLKIDRRFVIRDQYTSIITNHESPGVTRK